MKSQILALMTLAASLAPAPSAGGGTEGAEEVRVVVQAALAIEGRNDHYVSNREPLAPSPLIKLPVGSIRPEGWLRQQLLLMADGMFGHLPELSRWCKPEGSAWMSPEGRGDRGWEELPYWLKGYGDLGYVLGDEKIIAGARRWIDAALASQEADGYFGPRENKDKHDVWPNMVMLDALRSYHEATGDERVIPFMTRYFRWQLELPREHLLPGSWQKIRGGDNLQSVYWLYNRTGDAWLLDLARKLHERTADWTAGIASWHGVNICQGFREPAQFYQQSRDPAHLEAAERNYREVMGTYGQVPGGMFGADENCRPGRTGPSQAAEACSMVEFMLSFELLLGITGNPLYSDRCEEVAFNSLPAALTRDLRALHYLTAPNMVRLDRENKSPGLQNGGCMLAYSAGERYRCCQHNVSHGWPYFAEHLWMATPGNGLAAVLYAPGTVTARVGGGVTGRFVVRTDYPFRDAVEVKVHLPRPARFPLALRIPGWCRRAAIELNGKPVDADLRPSTFAVLDREWKDDDRIRLRLPMEIEVRTWERQKNAVSIDRGPLTYSLRIGEQWVKFGGTDAWPEWEVFPTTPWNYALVIDRANPAASLEAIEKDGELHSQPFDLDCSPVQIRASGRRLPAWGLEGGLAGDLQGSPARSAEPVEEITLIPMGCARLRIAAFPVHGDGPGAVEWVKPEPLPVAASHIHDSLGALIDGVLPASSGDHSIPRFTWWDHRGTVEWVSRTFEKPRRIAGAEVYWFDDTGRGQCRVPLSWKLLWKDGDAWREVSNPSSYGVESDRFNRAAFDPVTASEFRIEARLRDGFSGGILEWRLAE